MLKRLRTRFALLTRDRTLRAVAVALVGGAPMLAACSADSTSSGDSDLIGGRPAAANEYPATLLVRGNCTVSKVGPRHILTAAHCVTGWVASSFQPGATIELTSSKGIGRFAEARDAGGEAGSEAGPAPDLFRKFTIERTEIEPAWKARCQTLGNCGSVHISGRNDMADAALIIVEEEITDVATAAIDLSPVDVGDSLVITGYGCEEAVGGSWDYTHQRLRIAEAEALPFDRVIHEGSFIYPEERATLAVTMGGLYVITVGPQDLPLVAHDAGPAEGGGSDGGVRDGGADGDGGVIDAGPGPDGRGGLCPGDSGGPLYRGRGDGLTVVGINANYTFSTGHTTSIDGTHSFMYGGSPVTNWHTRVDGKSGQKVGAWLRGLGANTVCSRGGC